MTLFRQLLLGVSLLFLFLLAGVEAIYLSNARTQLQQQLGAQAQDAATTLALRLASPGAIDDPVLVETMMSPLFDRGYFREILVVSVEGKVVARKTLPPGGGEVPEWFVTLFPIDPPGAQSLVSAGWRELGRVIVVSQPHFTYLQLWRTGGQTIAWLLLGYVLAVAAAIAFLTMLLRPLREIERAAVAIGERDLVTIAARPRARELARVVQAINQMSGRIHRVMAEEAARGETYRRDAFIDPLTTLSNRRGFEQQMQLLTQSRSDVYSGALALVEIREFGEFNARVGYRRGDEVLAKLAAALAAACDGRTAVCSRLGGAGFSFAAVNLGRDELDGLVEAACTRLEQVIAGEGLEAELHFHCGATYWEGPLPKVPALLAAADAAVATARGAGENAREIESFDQALSLGSQDWRDLIVGCIEGDRIALFAQEAFGIADRKPLHVEVTARLFRPGEEPIPASHFLPMAVRHGLVGQLDCRVFEKLLDHCARTADTGRIAFNVAAWTIADAQSSRSLLGLLETHAALARRVTFEMTEFGAMLDLDLTRRFGNEVRHRGAQFALDNFGMRQDTLKLVNALRPEYIKLSAGYSREIADSLDCRFLVSSLVRITRPLGIDILAQAVENDSLLPLFAELGIAGYQGYVVSKPVRIA